MKKIHSRIISAILLIATLLSINVVSAFATTHRDEWLPNNDDRISSAVIEQATAWLEKNYSEFYDLRNVVAEIARVFENNDETRYTVAISCETKLKYDSVEELPFVKGLNSAFTGRSVQVSERSAVDAFISEIDARIGEYSGLAVDLVIAVSKEDTDAPWKMYFQDGMETTLYEVDVLALDSKEEMYDAGLRTANDIFTAVSAYATPATPTTRGYASYNRLAARDYALTWTTNATSCYDDGVNCSIKQNRTKWNNIVYPYFSLFKHDDCADFVSQAMSAGGLPEGGNWFRIKRSSNQDWGAAWTKVSSLKAYMTDSKHKYWDSSTYAACNAGNIILTSSSHVVMVTLNDTVSHRFSAHTIDRRDYAFSNVSSYQYFTIKTA